MSCKEIDEKQAENLNELLIEAKYDEEKAIKEIDWDAINETLNKIIITGA